MKNATSPTLITQWLALRRQLRHSATAMACRPAPRKGGFMPLACKPLMVMTIAALLAGCSSYRFVSPVPEKYRKLAIPVLASDVTQAEAEAVLTQALRREALRSGEFTIVGEADAALVMRGRVTGYNAKPVRYLRRTSSIPAEYRVTMSARVSLVEAGAEAVVVPEFSCSAEATAMVRDDLPTAKATVLNEVAQRLARSILLEASARFDK